VELGGRLWKYFRPDAISVWDEPVVRERLSWYYAVMKDAAPAKYHIAARIEAPADVGRVEYEELWRIHDKLAEEFDKIWREQKERPDVSLTRKSLPKASFLDVKIELANRIVRSCILCERKCRVDRAERKGACMLDKRALVSSYFHHLGEEAPLVPSGTIFFAGCNFRCVYCQNWDISQNPSNGVEISPETLAILQIKLRETGARNINWVGGEPTPNIHVILPSLKILAQRGANMPQLWNSNMYLSLEGLKLILHLMDIWLPDFKYGDDKCASRYSVVPNYLKVVTRNFEIICSRGEDIIIRHLVLPEHVECCTDRVLAWIASKCPRALVNIMDQYHPEHLVLKSDKYREIRRRLSHEEIEKAYKLGDRYGLAWREVTR